MQRLSLRLVLTLILLGAALLTTRIGLGYAYGQLQLPGLPVWFPPVWQQALNSPEPAKPTPGKTPPVIPQYFEEPDASGMIATYQPKGSTVTAGNAFFYFSGQ